MTVNTPVKQKLNLRPFKYKKVFDAYVAIKENPWTPTKTAMGKDVLDWQNASDVDRQVISYLLRGFTLLEGIVGENWSKNIADIFPVAELRCLIGECGNQEANHMHAYDHLENTLGLDTYEEFIQDEIACKKIEDVLNARGLSLGLNLVVFGAGVEGVSLFSSFGVLLSFNCDGKFQGLGQIISYSIVDESLHSDFAIELYNTFVREHGDKYIPKQKDVHYYMDLIVQNEIKFLEAAFKGIDSTLKKEAIEFVKYRANEKLKQVDFDPLYDVKYDDVKRINRLVMNVVEGSISNDFFASKNNGVGYTTAKTRDYSKVVGSDFLKEMESLLAYA